VLTIISRQKNSDGQVCSELWAVGGPGTTAHREKAVIEKNIRVSPGGATQRGIS
jgi:hypothetical protein